MIKVSKAFGIKIAVFVHNMLRTNTNMNRFLTIEADQARHNDWRHSTDPLQRHIAQWIRGAQSNDQVEFDNENTRAEILLMFRQVYSESETPAVDQGDLIEQIAALLARADARNVLTGPVLRLLRDAVLIPEERSRLASMTSHMGCISCGDSFAPHEIATFVRSGGTAGFACVQCARPQVYSPIGHCDHTTPLNDRIARETVKPCAQCAEAAATNANPTMMPPEVLRPTAPRTRVPRWITTVPFQDNNLRGIVPTTIEEAAALSRGGVTPATLADFTAQLRRSSVFSADEDAPVRSVGNPWSEAEQDR